MMIMMIVKMMMMMMMMMMMNQIAMRVVVSKYKTKEIAN